MPYDRWFNNPIILLTAFNSVEQRGYAHKPCFKWTNVPITGNYTPTHAYPRFIKKIGGYYVAGYSDSGMRSALFYSSSLTSGWQIACKNSFANITDPGPLCIESGLVAVGLHPGDSVNSFSCDYKVSWASDPSASWNTKKIYYKGMIESTEDYIREVEGYLTAEPTAFTYGGGLYVISAWQGNNLFMLSASSPNAAYWDSCSYMAAADDLDVRVTDMIYANGEYVACGYIQQIVIQPGQIAYGTGACHPFIAHTAFPSGQWQSGTIDSSSCYLMKIGCNNGLITALGVDADGKLYVYYASSASGPWARRYIAESNAGGDVVYADGKWLISYYGLNEYENPIDQIYGRTPSYHIAITDDLANGRILKYALNRDPFGDPYVETNGNFNIYSSGSSNTRMLYDNGKLAILSSGNNMLVGDFPFENFDMVYP